MRTRWPLRVLNTPPLDGAVGPGSPCPAWLSRAADTQLLGGRPRSSAPEHHSCAAWGFTRSVQLDLVGVPAIHVFGLGGKPRRWSSAPGSRPLLGLPRRALPGSSSHNYQPVVLTFKGLVPGMLLRVPFLRSRGKVWYTLKMG